MAILYYSHQCPDTPSFKEFLEIHAFSYEDKDVSGELKHLKEFVALRDVSPVFVALRGTTRLGVPCFVTDEGEAIIDLDRLKEII